MRKIKYTHFFLIFIITFSLIFVPVHRAQAVIPVIDKFHSLINKIFHGFSLAGQALTNASLGLPGTGSAARAGLKAGKAPCKAYDRSIAIAETADNFGDASIIAGSAGELTKLTVKIQALNTLKLCYSAMLDVIEYGGGAAVGVAGNQALEQISGEDQILTQRITELESRLDRLRELRTQVAKEIWKAVAIRTLNRAQLRITTNLVNQMIQKYRVGNFLDYSDALAGQVYMVDYINKNVTDGKDQAIFRSLIKNPINQNLVMPLIRLKAQQNLGFDVEDLSIYDENFYEKMAYSGAANVDPFFLRTVAEDELDQARAQSALLAKQEIDSGGGIISIRQDCQDISIDQQRYDQKNIELSKKVRDAEETLINLQSALLLYPKQVDPKEIEKAKKALEESQKELQDLANSSPNQAFKKACGSIVNPGSMVGGFTNSYLSSHLGAGANLRSENLPFFAGFIENMANNFVTKIIEGGRSNIKLITDRGFTNVNIPTKDVVGNTTDTQSFKEAAAETEASSVIFNGERINADRNEYTLQWNAESLTGASYIIITGPNRFTSRNDLAGSLNIIAPIGGGSYTMKVYTSDNRVLYTTTFNTAGSVSPRQTNISQEGSVDDVLEETDRIEDRVDTGPDIPPDNPAGEEVGPMPIGFKANLEGQVAGVSIIKPIILIRGPVGVSPRGLY